MRRLLAVLFLILAMPALGAIPFPQDYDTGVLTVPEDYLRPQGKKIGIYWERLRSTAIKPRALICINGGPGMTHSGFHRADPAAPGAFLPDYLAPLRAEFDIYYFDQRGAGKSAPLALEHLPRLRKELYGTRSICMDIETLRMKVIRQDTVVVFGESYGGMVALTYGTMFPQRLQALVLHDTAPSNEYFVHMGRSLSSGLDVLEQGRYPGLQELVRRALICVENGDVVLPAGVDGLARNDLLGMSLSLTYTCTGQHALAVMMKQIANDGRSAVLDALLAHMGTGSSGGSTFPVTTFLVQLLEMQDEMKIEDDWLSGPSPMPFDRVFMDSVIFEPRRRFRSSHEIPFAGGFDLRQTLRTGVIRVPVLVFVGRYDCITPLPFAQDIVRCIGPRARLEILEKSGHGGFGEENALVLDRMMKFLAPNGHWPSPSVQCADEGPMNPLEATKLLPAFDLGRRYAGF